MISILPDIEWSPAWEQIIGSACFIKEVLHSVVGTPNGRQGLNNFASARRLQRSQAMQLAVRSLQAATYPKQSSFTSSTGMTRFHFKRHFSTPPKEKMNMRPNSLILSPRTINPFPSTRYRSRLRSNSFQDIPRPAIISTEWHIVVMS